MEHGNVEGIRLCFILSAQEINVNIIITFIILIICN